MAASVTATSVLPVPPKPEPSVITPDFSDGARIASIVWRRHSAASSRLALSRLPGAATNPCLTARREKAPRIPFSAGATALGDRGEGVAQAAASLPGNPFHHSPIRVPVQDNITTRTSIAQSALPARHPAILGGGLRLDESRV